MINSKNDTLKILITGGSGFVSQNIIGVLRADQRPLMIYNLGRTPIEGSDVINIPCEATTYNFETLIEQFDYIIHTLALSNEAFCKDFSYAEILNIDFTKKLLLFTSTQKNLKKFIYISTIILYDNNNHPPVDEDGKLYLHHSTYGFTKGIAEYYVNHYREKFNLPAIIFRLSNIYGPHQKYSNSPFLVPSKIVQAITEGKIEVFSLLPKRDWIYSEDAARAIVKSLYVNATGIFNLGCGEGHSVGELMEEISKNLKAPITSLEKQTSGPINFYCDITKTKEIFSWQPNTSLHEGMNKTIEYIKNKLEKR